jgi:hypothetical protein
MNKRILKLAVEAGVTGHFAAGTELATPIPLSPEMQKFAELIVREMCSVLDKAQWDKGEDWICADGTRIIPQIKQHFGVAE